MCDGLLDWFSECPHCGWNGLDYEDEDEEEMDSEDYDLDFDEQGRYMGDVIKELWPIIKCGREAVQGFIAMKQFQANIEQIQAMSGHSQEQLDEIRQGILNTALMIEDEDGTR